MERPAELNPKRVWMPEEETERMNRGEFEAMRCLLGAVSYLAHASDGLGKRLGMLKDGKRWMAMLLGGLRAISQDLIGTMPRGQCKQIRNTMEDMEMRMVPHHTPMSQNVIFEKDIAKDLIDAAQEKCKVCAETAESCRTCSVYKILESTVHVDDYESSMLCPYANREWGN